MRIEIQGVVFEDWIDWFYLFYTVAQFWILAYCMFMDYREPVILQAGLLLAEIYAIQLIKKALKRGFKF